jgi:hypothetical protein
MQIAKAIGNSARSMINQLIGRRLLLVTLFMVLFLLHVLFLFDSVQSADLTTAIIEVAEQNIPAVVQIEKFPENCGIKFKQITHGP